MPSSDYASSSAAGTHSAALDIGFRSVATQHGESSSRAESRSSGRRSERSTLASNEDAKTPNEKSNIIDGLRHSGSSARRRVNKASGFLLDPMFSNGSPRELQDRHGKSKMPDIATHGDNQKLVPTRISHEASLRDSPLSRTGSTTASGHGSSDVPPVPRPQAIDPTKLVQMALDLSESRKRNISNTIPLVGRRDVSGGTIESLASSTSKHRPSRPSNVSADAPTTSADARVSVDSESTTDNISYYFTPATLSRAEKARKYFEQASEYRRLLQRLPPLEQSLSKEDRQQHGPSALKSPKSHKPTDSTVTAASTGLGRKYNPIQSLRNRRIRIRERIPFPTPEEYWQDTESVRRWVDEVESTSQGPQYRLSANKVKLPNYPEFEDAEDAQKHEVMKGRRRADTVSSVIMRPENSWTIEPSELLADAYWTEKDDNKRWLENRRGDPLFAFRQLSQIESPRHSVDVRRPLGEAASSAVDFDSGEAGASSRRRKLLPSKVTDPRRHKRLLSRASSVSSTTSVDSPIVRSRKTQNRSVDENTGPLERYMQQRIAKEQEERKVDVSSPEAASPNRLEIMHRQSIDRGQHDRSQFHNGRASLDVPLDFHRRSQSADGRVNPVENTLSSADETEADEVHSATHVHGLASAIDLSFYDDRQRALERHKGKRSKLGLFRSQSKERHKIAQTDFADDTNGAALAPILSADSGRTRTSFDSSRPGSFRRHRTGDSISSILGRSETTNTSNAGFGSSKEPSSSVGRFFKGGRIGDLVRGEGNRLSDRIKGREKLEDDAPVAVDSDTDDNISVPGFARADTDDSDGSPRGSLESSRMKTKYHMGNLPAFTSSVRDKRLHLETRQTHDGEPNDKAKAPQTSGQAQQSDHLFAPRIVLSSERNASNPELKPEAVGSLNQNSRKNYGPLQLNLQNNELVPFTKTLFSPGGRHWSISDQATPTTTSSTSVTKRDIARAEALLLSSGIKAREIMRRGDATRDPPNPLLVRAAATANQPLPCVPRKEDDSVAARLICDVLDSRLSMLEAALSSFQSHTAASVASRLDNLHAHAADRLTTRVQETSDAADAFIVELTTLQPQHTKQVHDAVDAMLRLRRRQFRLLRRAGFKLLEWFTLSLMWGIWFTVVILNLIRRCIVALFRFLHWLFTF